MLPVFVGFLVVDLALFLALGATGRRLFAGLTAFGLPLLAAVGLARLLAGALEGRRR